MDVTLKVVLAHYPFVWLVSLDFTWKYIFPIQPVLFDWRDCLSVGIAFHYYLNHEFLADKAACAVSGMDVYKDTLTRYWLYGSMKSLVNPFAYSTRLMRLSMLKKPSSLTGRKYWIGCLLPLLAVYAWAFAEPRVIISEAEQKVTVTGIVTDEDGNNVIAASVLCPAKALATISDADGRYVLTIGKNDTIHIQMSGYKSQKICIGSLEIKDDKATINVQLSH